MGQLDRGCHCSPLVLHTWLSIIFRINSSELLYVLGAISNQEPNRFRSSAVNLESNLRMNSLALQVGDNQVSSTAITIPLNFRTNCESTLFLFITIMLFAGFVGFVGDGLQRFLNLP